MRLYRPELDALRFFAFGAVFIHHTLPWSDGAGYAKLGLSPAGATLISAAVQSCAAGVDLFFLLSSFLITTLLLREHEQTGRMNIAAFLMRRGLRIWPLYFTYLAVALFALPRLGLVGAPSARETVGFLTFTANWLMMAEPFASGMPVHLWSLSVEEQFYVGWPIILALAGMSGVRVAALGLLAAGIASRLAFPDQELNTLSRIDPIAVGALLAAGIRTAPRFPWTTRLALLVVGVSIPPIAVLTFKARSSIYYPAITLACTCVFLAFYGARVTWRPLVYLGRISYGLYVFHALMINLSMRGFGSHGIAALGSVFGLSLASTVALSAASYRWFESPFLRMKERFAPQGGNATCDHADISRRLNGGNSLGHGPSTGR